MDVLVRKNHVRFQRSFVHQIQLTWLNNQMLRFGCVGCTHHRKLVHASGTTAVAAAASVVQRQHLLQQQLRLQHFERSMHH